MRLQSHGSQALQTSFPKATPEAVPSPVVYMDRDTDRDEELTKAVCFCGWKEEEAGRHGYHGKVILVSCSLFTPLGLSRQEFPWHGLHLYN